MGTVATWSRFGARFARQLEHKSRSVTIAGHGRRARSDMGDFLGRCLSAVAEFIAGGSVLKGGWPAVGPRDCHRVAEEVTPAPPLLLLNVFLLPARVRAVGTRR